uniref:RING-type domain-containing protein n=1 Tax=Parascaris univalens TaxID=6257 RepID=A0A915B2A4_PARUN
MCSSNGHQVPLIPTDNENVLPLEKFDDLSSKYGIANENAVCTKKRSKKIKSRPLDIEFPLHGNGLTRKYDSGHLYRTTTDDDISLLYCDEFPVVSSSNNDEQKIDDILPVVKDIFREFLHNIGSNISSIEELAEFLTTVEISDYDEKILNDLVKRGYLQQLIERSQLFDIFDDDGRISLTSKREGGVGTLRKPNIFQNLLRSSNNPPDNLNACVMDNPPGIIFREVPNSSLCQFVRESIANGQMPDTRPSSADANRSVMNYTAWGGNPLAHGIVQNVVGYRDPNVDRLRHQLAERDNELARLKDHSEALFIQMKKVMMEKDALEKRLLEAEAKLRQKDDCLQRETEQSRSSVEREKKLEREVTDLRAENATYKGIVIAERSRLKRAYKELLELRLGKAKTLAKRRIEQAKSGVAHAEMLQKRCPINEIKKHMQEVIKQWQQIGDDYEGWLSNLDKLADAQKVLIDEDNDFDELPLLTPPNHIPGAPSVPHSLISWCSGTNTTVSLDCANNGDAATLNVNAPPPGFEGNAVRGGRYGAIGQPKVSHLGAFGDGHHTRKLALLRPPPSIPLENASSAAPWASSHNERPRVISMDNHECKICLNPTVSGVHLLKCPNPGCNEPFHKDCVIGWVKSDNTCPNCRGLWRDPMEFPTLSAASS